MNAMYPPHPTRLGKKTRRKTIDGGPLHYEVIEEIHVEAKATKGKIFSLHRLKHEDGREDFRIGYYMIAHKPRAKGKWAWGQFAPMISREELTELVNTMKTAGWL